MDLGWLCRCREQLRDGKTAGLAEPEPTSVRHESNDLGEVAHLRHFRSFLKYMIATYCGLGSTWGLWVPGIELNLEIESILFG